MRRYFKLVTFLVYIKYNFCKIMKGKGYYSIFNLGCNNFIYFKRVSFRLFNSITYYLFLIFVGGIMVLFMYVVSLLKIRTLSINLLVVLGLSFNIKYFKGMKL